MLPERKALLLTIGLILLCGCRVNPNAEREIALLRSEIVDLEDQYYALKSQRDTAIVQLQDCQGSDFDGSQFQNLPVGQCINCDNGVIVNQSPVVYDSPIIYEDQGYPFNGQVINGPVIGNGVSPIDLNTSDQIQSFDTGEPIIDSNSSLEEVPAVEDTESRVPAESEGNGESTSILNRRPNASQSAVSTIRIHPRLSRGQDLDGAPGHEGLALLIQPSNRQGNVVDEIGQLTVQLTQADRLVSTRQIGFWRFTPEEIESFQVRQELPDQGILLHLPWSEILPTKNKVNVVVNFLTLENARYVSRLEIPIQPPARRYRLDDPLIADWIENDSSWKADAPDIEFADDEMDFEDHYVEPDFYNASEPLQIDSPIDLPETDRKTSVPRWRPIR